MLPRDPQAQKFLSVAKLAFDPQSGKLLSFEFDTKDGSSMRNDFTNVRLNDRIDPARFQYDFSGYDVAAAKP
jgi:outer membrane lipoprotein-sorting protein